MYAFAINTASVRRTGWAPWLIAWLLGCSAQLAQPTLWKPLGYLCALLAGAALIALVRHNGRMRPWRAAAGALLCGFALCGLRAAAFQSQAIAPAIEGQDLLLTGTVAAMPQPSATGLRFRFEVESAERDGQPVPTPPLIELGWWTVGNSDDPVGGDALPDIRAGQRWRLATRLKAPHGSRNPHGFDYELWAWSTGVQAEGSVRTGHAPPVLLEDRLWSHPVERARQSVRDAILVRLAGASADDADDATPRRRAAGVVAALVTGDQRAIERSDWDIFRATGVAHLMSISGLHVTMFAWLAAGATGWLWRRSARLCMAVPAPQAALAGGVVLAALYATFSGGGLPAQRTVLMLAIVAALRMSGRRWPWPQVWLLACAGAAAFDPWALLQAGFWLSFVAVGVLFASSRPAADRVADASGGLMSRPAALLREQVVVTVALTPLSLWLFGQVSLVGLPANLLAIPWTTLVVTPLALLGGLFPPLWDLAALAVRAMVWLLQPLAAWPNATVSLPAAPVWVAVTAILGGAIACMPLPVRMRLLGVAPLLPVLLWTSEVPAAGHFELLAADIGQGSAVLVRTAHHALLYDAGPRWGPDSDAGQRTLVPLLQALGTGLDTLVLSHRDTDHVGGAAALLAHHPAATLRSSIEPGHPLQALRPALRCEAGQHWRWDGVDFTVMHPQPTDYRPGIASNALSCVLRIEAGGRSALLTGDIGEAEEEALVASGADLRADWLMVPHHGSRSSSSQALLRAVAPMYAIAQAGYRNRFGHPAASVLARYRDQGIHWVDTVHCGAARWHSAFPEQIVCERVRDPHYWQHNAP
ncbi:DNA internalization-related competence protein ComEC/Rec2 [Xylophilus sp. GOD-11R]|uniref:DNA internalization-related competence protein ComEC/Rec2 n=1 Tax=Xylophilus sp. GOD-11R TaxID=3089814 RepID=UPI00298D11C7|nr:DNA internalization-related competence protein ComEC/Rec2 [Xylophilus sp. GOD-11R]WPB58197.1 DNA internalization-related competence protein ComEC/Rec2 [Xylophilus sp. GOD-11R]